MKLLELLYDERCSLRTLHLHPNPWYQPKPAEDGPNRGLLRLKLKPTIRDPDLSGNRWLTRPFDTVALRNNVTIYAFFRARSPVEVLYSSGAGPTNFQIGRRDTFLPTEDWESEPAWPANLNRPLSKKVPSLMELSLRACLRSPYLANLSEFLDPRLHHHLFGLLGEAQEWQETGGMTCTVCQEPVIKPTAQWIEWWQIYESRLETSVSGMGVHASRHSSEPAVRSLSGNQDEKLIPFIRRACSWRCVLHPVRGLGSAETQTTGETNKENLNDERVDTTDGQVAHSG